MKIYTKTGDTGITQLGNGSRVKKNHAQIEVYGNIDELNSAIGMVQAYDIPKTIKEILTRIQHELFDLGNALSLPEKNQIHPAYIKKLEDNIDELDEKLPPIKAFILPAGSLAASHCHLARAICRRTERSLVQLSETITVKKEILEYINRLSDLLFVIARNLSE